LLGAELVFEGVLGFGHGFAEVLFGVAGGGVEGFGLVDLDGLF
jgi:hypothetical protein